MIYNIHQIPQAIIDILNQLHLLGSWRRYKRLNLKIDKLRNFIKYTIAKVKTVVESIFIVEIKISSLFIYKFKINPKKSETQALQSSFFNNAPDLSTKNASPKKTSLLQTKLEALLPGATVEPAGGAGTGAV